MDLVLVGLIELVGVLVVVGLAWRLRILENALADMQRTIAGLVEAAIADEMKRMDDRIRTWVRRLSEPEADKPGPAPAEVMRVFAGQPMDRG